MTRLIARKGEKVTRENSEYICRVAHDIYRGDVPKVANFDDWQIPVPAKYSRFPDDKIGERWIRNREFSPGFYVGDIHLARGWSNETDPPEHSERPE